LLSRLILAIAASLSLIGAAGAAELKLLASGATKGALESLLPQFEKSANQKIIVTWASSQEIRQRMQAGEAYDLVIGSGPDIDNFTKQGKLSEGSRVDLFKSFVGVAVGPGKQKPDIGTPDALKSALLAASMIGYSTGPSGDYVVKLFDRLGVADSVKAKLKQAPPSQAVGDQLANGEVDIGFQQVSELLHYPGIVFAGPLPASLQNVTIYAAGWSAQGGNADIAKALISFLRTPAAVVVIKEAGLEPG
jgi:molybdate transport system substrate-binding protein